MAFCACEPSVDITALSDECSETWLDCLWHDGRIEWLCHLTKLMLDDPAGQAPLAFKIAVHYFKVNGLDYKTLMGIEHEYFEKNSARRHP